MTKKQSKQVVVCMRKNFDTAKSTLVTKKNVYKC